MELADLFKLEPHGPDTFMGEGPLYPWGSLYGGQIVAQGLRAASYSVEPEHRVHSLHAYFIRRGKHDAPVRFEVDRVRDGRTFTTRSVTARQSEGAILHMSCSFQLPEGEAEVQTQPMPEVERPEDVAATACGIPLMERRLLLRSKEGRKAGWFRSPTPLGDDPYVHAAGLAFLSDDLPCDSVALRHPEGDDTDGGFWLASLDHAIWFHHPARADDWLLFDFQCQSLVGTRGLSIGHVFDATGHHIATVSQEVLLRRRR